MHEGVINIHNSHLWTWDNPQAICEHGCEAHFSVSIWDGIVGDIAVGPSCYLTG
jgi:hypothetical protein